MLMKLPNCLFVFILLLLVQPAFSQKWVEMMWDPKINFYDVQKEFYRYWNEKEKEEQKEKQVNIGPQSLEEKEEAEGGWLQFKRWEWYMEPRVYPTGDRSILDKNRTSYKSYYEGIKSTRDMSNSSWTYIGQDSVPQYAGAGRVICIRFDPVDPSVIYIGTSGGGIWKSINNGQSWTVWHTDTLLSLAISDIAIAPTNNQLMYLGGNNGAGLKKSVDGGNSWNSTTLDTFSRYVSRVLIDPANPQVVHAATHMGIYKSTNGGVTWTQASWENCTDMEFKPGDPTTIYASNYSSVFRSTDSGQSYSQVHTLPNTWRISIAVTPANPNYLYVLGTNGTYFTGLYRSTNSGLSFSLQSSSPNILSYSFDGSDSTGQGYWDLAIAADPTNAEHIYVGGIHNWRSTDGGVTWIFASDYDIHADKQDLAFQPGSNTIYSANDGGIYSSSNNGISWTDLSHTLHIGEIYRLGLSAQNPNFILSGWQDNGTNMRNSSGNWQHVFGGDGMECIVDYSNNNIIYLSTQNGNIYKSTDGGLTVSSTIVSNYSTGVNGIGAWITPYIIHPTDPNTLIVGKDYLYKTTDGGLTWSQLGNMNLGYTGLIAYAPSNPDYIYAISTGLWVSSDGVNFIDRTAGLPTGSYVSNIAISDTDPAKVWVTLYNSNGNNVYYSSNAGQTWSNYSAGLPHIPASCIVYQNNSNEDLYVGADYGIYHRNAGMASWEFYSNGLPNVRISELEIQHSVGKIRAATYGRGMWESPLATTANTSAYLSGAERDNYIKVFPNPNSGEFDIVIENSKNTSKIEITNYLGQKIYVENMKSNSGVYKKHFNLNKYGKGVYLITLFDKQNKLEKKVVVQ